MPEYFTKVLNNIQIEENQQKLTEIVTTFYRISDIK